MFYAGESSSEEEEEIDSESVVATFKGHRKWVNKAICFSQYNLLASCSDDKTIRIWNLSTCKCEKVITRFGWIVDIIKWDENTFLAAGRDGLVEGYRITDYSRVFSHPIRIYSSQGYPHRLMKITLHPQYFLCVFFSTQNRVSLSSYSANSCIVNFDDGMIIKTLKKRTVTRTCQIENSRVYGNSFYYSCEGKVLLIDYELDEETRTFQTPNNDGTLNIFSIYLDQCDQEILIGGGKSTTSPGKVIYFFKTNNNSDSGDGDNSNNQCFRKIDLRRFKGPGYFDTLYSSLIIEDKYFFFGGYCGTLFFLDISDEMNAKIGRKKVINESILTNICFCNINNERISLCLCFESPELKLIEIQKREISDLTFEDLNERIKFLIEILSDEKYLKNNHQILSIGNFNIFKILLL